VNFKTFCKSSYQELFDFSVKAFPKTKLRQHVIDAIKISEIKFIPYLGMKTLYIKCLATNEERQYHPMILFKGVNYRDRKSSSVIPLKVNEAETRYVEIFDRSETQVLVRCDCKDFRWRFSYTDWNDRSLYGNKHKKYEANGRGNPANPKELPGTCKHIMKMMNELQQVGLVKR
jgi:hypothetical protein